MTSGRLGRRAALVWALGSAACGSSGTQPADAGEPDATQRDGPSADHWIADQVTDVIVDRSAEDSDAMASGCMEGMKCQANDPSTHMPDFDCECARGKWSCAIWSLGGTVGEGLPSTDPDPSQRCWGVVANGGANVACSLPDRCGTFCFCGQGTGSSNWDCETIVETSDAESIRSGVPDASSPASADAGCPWAACPIAEDAAAICQDGGSGQCVVVACSPIVCGPSGSAQPLPGHCYYSN